MGTGSQCGNGGLCTAHRVGLSTENAHQRVVTAMDEYIFKKLFLFYYYWIFRFLLLLSIIQLLFLVSKLSLAPALRHLNCFYLLYGEQLSVLCCKQFRCLFFFSDLWSSTGLSDVCLHTSPLVGSITNRSINHQLFADDIRLKNQLHQTIS